MTDIAEVVKQIVSQINTEIVGKINNTTMKNEFCDTKWARKGKKLFRPSTETTYLITGVETDNFIDAIPISSPVVFGNGVYELPAPFFISGTRLATNREWTLADKDLTKKTPIIWLLETTEEEHFGRGDSREFEASMRIFFLDETNIKDFYTEDHRREVVLPMQKLVDQFIETINNDSRFQTIESFRIRTFSRFGVEQENGMFQNILDANLSGVELVLSLTKFKENCKC
jgi:hypothetical protein